jgi:hypothetical protein
MDEKKNFDNITKALFFYVKKSPIAADTIKKYLGTKSGKNAIRKILRVLFNWRSSTLKKLNQY